MELLTALFLLFLLCGVVYWISLPFVLIAKRKTKQAMFAEASRLAAEERKVSGGVQPRGFAWETEKARLIDDVIAPKFGGRGKQLARTTDVRGRLEELLEGREDAPSNDWTSDPSKPRAGNHSYGARVEGREYAGRQYAVHTDDCVVCQVDGKPLTWRNEAGFREWALRNVPPGA